MKRLIKKALMDIKIFESTLSQLSTKGRNVLKIIEDYKFTIEQTTRLMANDQHLAQKIIQKKKVLDQAAGLIYSVVFDIENIDITQEYQDQVQEVENGPENLPINNEDGEAPEIPENKNLENINPEVKEVPETKEVPSEEKSIEEKPIEENEPKDMRKENPKKKPEKENPKKENPKKPSKKKEEGEEIED